MEGRLAGGRQIRVYRINTGSCRGCDREIGTVVADEADLVWADTPQDADVLLLTGPITHGSKAALLKLLQDVSHTPVLAIGRCAMDGHPFGKGGVAEFEEMMVQLRMRLDGCPPLPEAMVETIRKNTP